MQNPCSNPTGHAKQGSLYITIAKQKYIDSSSAMVDAPLPAAMLVFFQGEGGGILAPPVFLSVSSTASRNLVTYLEQGQSGIPPEGFIPKQLGFCGGKLAEMIYPRFTVYV